MEAAIGIEPMNKGFADLCLTTWLRRHAVRIKDEGGKMKCSNFISPPSSPKFVERETRFELATLALARRCSTTELLPLFKKTAVFKVVERNVPLFLSLCPEALFPPLVDHYGPRANHNSPGRAHENGDIEQSRHGPLTLTFANS